MSEFGRLHDESIAYIRAIQDYLKENYTDRGIHKLEGKARKDAEKVLAENAIYYSSNESAFLERTGMASKLVALDSNKGSAFLLEIRASGGSLVFSSRIYFDENGNCDVPHLPPPEPIQQLEFNEEDKVDHRTVALLATCNKKWLLSINLKHHMLTLPIGKVHPNESLLEGLCREMREELGFPDLVYMYGPGNIILKTRFKKTYDFDGTPVDVETFVFHVDSDDRYANGIWGVAENREPEKCGGLMWVNRDDIRRIAESTGLLLADCVEASLQADMVNVEHIVQ